MKTYRKANNKSRAFASKKNIYFTHSKATLFILLPQIYIYIVFKNEIVAFIVNVFVEPRQWLHHPSISNYFSLSFLALLLNINFIPYYYISFNLSPSLLPFHLSITLITLIPTSFYFGSSYSHTIAINLIFSLSFYTYFPTQKGYYSLTLSLFPSFFFFSFFCV